MCNAIGRIQVNRDSDICLRLPLDENSASLQRTSRRDVV